MTKIYKHQFIFKSSVSGASRKKISALFFGCAKWTKAFFVSKIIAETIVSPPQTLSDEDL